MNVPLGKLEPNRPCPLCWTMVGSDIDAHRCPQNLQGPISVPALGDPRTAALEALRAAPPPEPKMQMPSGPRQGTAPRPYIPERERILANIALLQGVGATADESEPLRHLQARLREIDAPPPAAPAAAPSKVNWAMWAIALAIAIDALVRLLRP